MRQVSILLLLVLLMVIPPAKAQEFSTAKNIFTWREAAMSIEYPAEWQVGMFDEIPVLASNREALANATQGLAPGAPALTFLYYAPTNKLAPDVFINTVFPDSKPVEFDFGVRAARAEFMDEPNGQIVTALAFESPATRETQLLVAAAPQDQWEVFMPIFEAILNSAKFFRNTAELSLFDQTVTFRYSLDWAQQGNGQVVVAASNEASALAVLNGSYEHVFVRAQLLTPSGLGIDPENETAAEDILTRFIGMPVEAVEIFERFDWGEGKSAVSAWFEFNGSRIVMIAVTEGDSALLVGGGAPLGEWESVQGLIWGSLNLTRFNDTFPTLYLTQIVTGHGPENVEIFGMATD